MEITTLEVSTQRHIDRMQDTANVKYVQNRKGSKKKNVYLVEKFIVQQQMVE